MRAVRMAAGETFKHGAFDYVAKPFDCGYLLNAIQAAVAYRGTLPLATLAADAFAYRMITP